MSAGFRQRGGGWVLIQFILMFAVLGLGPWQRGYWGNGFTLALGLTLLSVSTLTGLTGVRDLGGNRTAFPRPNDGAPLITTGIYGWVRHPLYVSVMAFSLAWALLWASHAALAAAVASAIFLDLKARHEERLLREKFPDYDAYARRVKRFLPGVY
jgi:protein-S-isoprenylcysteine O-methyltransferase Ste14